MITITFILLTTIIFIFYSLLIFPTKWLRIEKIEHHLGIHKKILQISDIHIKNLRVKPEKLVTVIQKEKPDYIVITGDMVDKNEYELSLIDDFFSVLKQTKVPIYAVLGNHDRYLPDVEKLEKILTKHQIILLKNEYVEEDNFYFVGIDDCSHGNENIIQSFNFEKNEKKQIVLTHNAELVLDELMPPFDYLMAGHLHGKQLNIPFLYYFKKMGKLPMMGIYKGKHRMKKGTIYISKGIGQTRFNIRFMVRSEVTIHEL